jgi:hypothetical protein
VSEEHAASNLRVEKSNYFILKIEVAGSFEMLLNIYQTIRRHFPEGITPDRAIDLYIEVNIKSSMIPQLKIKLNIRHGLKTFIKCPRVKRRVMYQTQYGKITNLYGAGALCSKNISPKYSISVKKFIYRRNQMKITGKPTL